MYNFIDQYFTAEFAIMALIGMATFGDDCDPFGPAYIGNKTDVADEIGFHRT